ncbi:hypothetical protein SD51_08295 [Alicyclobacillus tengchongensis]|nr:hypothetical protein SD51_08295 [Alicyclobacillus tengchongensis]
MGASTSLKPIIRLSICNMLFYLCSQFSNLFINIYIYQGFSSLRVTALYNVVMYVFWIGAFIVGGVISKSSTKRNIMFGALWGIGAIALLMIIPHGILVLDLVVAAMMGIASGFYYMGYNLVLFQFSNAGERGQTIARFNLATSCIAAAMPTLSATVIHAFGYTAMFTVVIAMFAAIFALARPFPRLAFTRTADVPAVPTPPRRRLLGFGLGTFAIAVLTCSLYTYFVNFAAGVLTYSYGSGILGAGWLNTLYALLSLVVNLVIGYGIRAKSDAVRQNFAWMGGAAATIGSALLFMHGSHLLIAFNVVVSLANPLFFSQVNAQQFDAVGQLFDNIATGFIVREALYSAARIGLFLYVSIFGFTAGSLPYFVCIAVLCLAPLATVAWNLRAVRMPSILLR